MIWTLKNYCIINLNLNLMQINMNFWSIYLRLNQRSWTPSELIKPSGRAIPLTVFKIDLKLITVHSSICYFVRNKKSVNKSEFVNKWGTTNRRMHSISHDYAYGQSLWRPFTFNFLYSDLFAKFSTYTCTNVAIVRLKTHEKRSELDC